MKKAIKTILCILLAIVVLAGGFLVWLTVVEYRPEDIEDVSAVSQTEAPVMTDDTTIHIVSWNTGYCGLGADASFVLDGGKGSGKPKQESTTLAYYSGIVKTLAAQNADICILQEVDSDSARSYYLDEASALQTDLSFACSTYALNYSCPFVPFPWPPIGKVNSGILTLSDYEIASAQRVSLPCPFSWPLRIANLKRCLLINRIPLAGRDQELVVVNLHLEAYDSGEGKAAQTAMLLKILNEEYAAGNYVIAGGDFNQSFPGALDTWPIIQSELWTPPALDESGLPEGWRYAYDLSTPTCRLLNQPYDPDDQATQYYVIDGFILSPNVELVSVETIDAGFAYTDHNPVSLEVRLMTAP